MEKILVVQDKSWMGPDIWYSPQDPATDWASWKVDMMPEQLVTGLYSQYNVATIPLQSLDAFHADVSSIAEQCDSRQEFLSRLDEKASQRRAELVSGLKSISAAAKGHRVLEPPSCCCRGSNDNKNGDDHGHSSIVYPDISASAGPVICHLHSDGHTACISNQWWATNQLLATRSVESVIKFFWSIFECHALVDPTFAREVGIAPDRTEREDGNTRSMQGRREGSWDVPSDTDAPVLLPSGEDSSDQEGGKNDAPTTPDTPHEPLEFGMKRTPQRSAQNRRRFNPRCRSSSAPPQSAISGLRPSSPLLSELPPTPDDNPTVLTPLKRPLGSPRRTSPLSAGRKRKMAYKDEEGEPGSAMGLYEVFGRNAVASGREDRVSDQEDYDDNRPGSRKRIRLDAWD